MSREMSIPFGFLHDAVRTGKIYKVELNLGMGSSVHERNGENQTALHVACQTTECDTKDIVALLLSKGSEVNVQDKFGRTPLHDACDTWSEAINSFYGEKIEHMDVIDLLLMSGAGVNIQDHDGRSLLHNACIDQNQRLVTTLLNNGAKTSVVDIWGKTPLHDASRELSISIVNALLSSGYVGSENSTTQHSGYHPEDGEIPNVLNHQDCDGYTALHYACSENKVEVNRLLLRAGANLVLKTNQGETALHCAATGGATDVVDVLLDNGEDVNAMDCSGNTPLHKLLSSLPKLFSPLKNLAKCIDILLSKRANVYAKNLCGETPYDVLIKSISRMGLIPNYYNVPNYHVNNSEHVETVEKMKEIFIKHVIKVRALTNQIRFDIKWRKGRVNFYSQSRRCCLELEDMKSTLIVNDISVFDVLSHKENHSYPLSSEDIEKVDEFLCSPDLLTRFPLYGHPLRITFQRPKLLTLAVQSFYTEGRKQVMKELPCEIAEKILTYLINEDLNNFVKSE